MAADDNADRTQGRLRADGQGASPVTSVKPRPGATSSEPLGAEELKRLYAAMLRIRTVEEWIAEHYPEQEMRCPVHLSIGQEAVAVGVCAGLGRQDHVLSAHRSHAHYLAKGGDLKAFFAELYGRATGCASGKGGSMHLIDLAAGFLGAVPIVGNTIPIAVGAAFSSRLGRDGRVAVVFFGEGTTEAGVYLESLNFAKLWNLPVVFVCENNLYSVYSPIDVRQPQDRDNAAIARGHGVESLTGHGNDVLTTRRLAGYAIQKAREGGGPTFLEFSTYRWREHCGPYYDNDLGYRTEREFQEWKAKDPLRQFEHQLRQDGQIDDAYVARLTAELTAEIDEAVAFAKASPWPGRDLLTAHVYAR